jgi:hypothetical protein
MLNTLGDAIEFEGHRQSEDRRTGKNCLVLCPPIAPCHVFTSQRMRRYRASRARPHRAGTPRTYLNAALLAMTADRAIQSVGPHNLVWLWQRTQRVGTIAVAAFVPAAGSSRGVPHMSSSLRLAPYGAGRPLGCESCLPRRRHAPRVLPDSVSAPRCCDNR